MSSAPSLRLVIYPSFDEERLAKVRAAAPDVDVINASDEASARDAIGDADAFFGKMTPVILASARRLRWIQTPTGSLEHYMFPELEAHPTVLTNMRGIHAKPIAEQVLGYVIAFARNLHRYVRLQSQALWAPVGGEEERSTFTTGPGRTTAIDREIRDVAGSTMGIVGMGAIGRAVAQRAAAFEMTILGVDEQPQVDVPGVADILPPARLNELLEVSDFVVVTLPHTPRTVGLFDRSMFDRMRTSALFINVGRGAVVVLDDLVNALQRGAIGGAALDVFQTEPLPRDHPLWAMDNVIITPHVAGFSPSIAANYLSLFLDNLTRFREGRPLRNEVDKRRWY